VGNLRSEPSPNGIMVLMLDVEVALELSIKELLSIFNRSQTRDETLIDKVRGIKVVLLNMLDSILKF